MTLALTIAIVLVLAGLAYGFYLRHHGNTTGAITHRSMEGRDRTGAEGASTTSDTESFEQHVDQRGTR